MAFDEKKFLKDKFEPRTQAVEISGLSDYFGDDEKSIMIVRGLTFSEWSYALDAKKFEDNRTLLEYANTTEEDDLKAKVFEMMGVDKKEIHRNALVNKQILMIGIAQPKLSERTITKLMNEQSGVFNTLANAIINLSNQGFCKKKSENCGKTI